MIRIGLADDEPLFSAGMAMLLGAQEDMEVLWQAVDGADALRRQRRDPADVLLLDVQMPVMGGLTATQRLVEDKTPGRIVILTTFDTDGYVLGAIEAGAAGFLLKNTAPQDLIAAVRTVHSGDSVISPGPTRRLVLAMRQGLEAHAASRTGAGTTLSPGAPGPRAAEPSGVAPAVLPDHVTDREREILALIAMGLTNQELCDRLWLSMATIKAHVSHLLAKTGCRDRVQLVLLALRTGVVDIEQILSAP